MANMHEIIRELNKLPINEQDSDEFNHRSTNMALLAEYDALKAKAQLFDEIYSVYDNGGTDFEVAQNMRIILAQYERANKLTGSK